MSWEDTFGSWASAPSETEEEKCENAERAIAKAVAASSRLKSRGVTVYAQGSYRNRTNVKADSDVDIGLLCRETFFYDLSASVTAPELGITPATYSYPEYKNDVEGALISHFGRQALVRGNKAFDVHENTYRLDADVVPCFPYRFYQSSSSYIEGRAFLTDAGQRIFNYPDQNYQNGVDKNDRTGRRFKALVRILKRIRNKMADENIAAAGPVPSYLIECLAWNVPDVAFTQASYTAAVRYVLAHLFNDTRQVDDCKNWREINDIKYLFHATQPWTLVAAHGFLGAAWDYIGFK